MKLKVIIRPFKIVRTKVINLSTIILATLIRRINSTNIMISLAISGKTTTKVITSTIHLTNKTFKGLNFKITEAKL